MQFLYTNYVYINTRDIKGNLMFAFGPYTPIHNCCPNPFGATIANPRINFALGIAAATAMPIMPMYRPCMPVFGFGYVNTYAYQRPAFGALTAQNYAVTPATNNYSQYFNRLPQVTVYNNYTFNADVKLNTNNNPFGYFNRTDNIKIVKHNYGTIPATTTTTTTSTSTTTSTTQTNTTKSNSTTSTSSTSAYSSVSTNSSTAVATDGQRLNRSGNDYGPEFLAKVKTIANRLNCNYRDLLGLMNSESGIRADIKNPNGSASGLIQFIESTANSLGTTTAQLRAMDPIDQLDYVERYLVQAKANAGISGRLSAGDLYSLVFLPGRAHRNVLTSSGENYYACNKGLDLNSDGQITKAELGQRVHNKYVSDNSFLA